MKILTYWGGEFGWELMAWQAHLRWLSNVAEIRVVTRKGNEMLYKDFATEILNYEFDGVADSHYCHNLNTEKFNKFLIKNKKDSTILAPYNIGYYPTKKGHKVLENFSKQTFIKLSSEEDVVKYDILLHPRNRDLAPDRNWGADNWNVLGDILIKNGYSVAVIGKAGESLVLDNEHIDAYFSVPLEETVALMQNARLIVGESSGAMHLAALAGLESVVWGAADNVDRYHKYWNPLKVPCDFLGELQPDVDKIMNMINKRL